MPGMICKPVVSNTTSDTVVVAPILWEGPQYAPSAYIIVTWVIIITRQSPRDRLIVCIQVGTGGWGCSTAAQFGFRKIASNLVATYVNGAKSTKASGHISIPLRATGGPHGKNFGGVAMNFLCPGMLTYIRKWVSVCAHLWLVNITYLLASETLHRINSTELFYFIFMDVYSMVKYWSQEDSRSYCLACMRFQVSWMSFPTNTNTIHCFKGRYTAVFNSIWVNMDVHSGKLWVSKVLFNILNIPHLTSIVTNHWAVQVKLFLQYLNKAENIVVEKLGWCLSSMSVTPCPLTELTLNGFQLKKGLPSPYWTNYLCIKLQQQW